MATPDTKDDPKLVKKLVIPIGVSRRCRAGICFESKGTVIELTPEQLKAVAADPHLRVEKAPAGS